MKQAGKKWMAALLALGMVLGLAACGSGGNKDKDQSPGGMVYAPVFTDCQLDLAYVSSGCCDGTYIYILGEEPAPEAASPDAGDAIPVSRYAICRLPVDGGAPERLAGYESPLPPADQEGYVNVTGLRLGRDGTLWVTESTRTYTYDLPAGFDPDTDDKWSYATVTSATILRQLDTSGSELARIDISGLEEQLDLPYMDSTQLDGDGSLYVSGEGSVYVLDPSLEVLFHLEEEGLWGNLVLLGDGRMGFVTWDQASGSQVLRTIDKAARGWGETYPLSGSVSSAYTGSGSYLFYYDNGDSLYGYDPQQVQADLEAGGSGAGEKLLSWSGCDINAGDLLFFTFLPDGRVAAMTQDRSGPSSVPELALLTKTDASALPEKTTLTYATLRMDYDLRSRIVSFNRRSDQYRIEIRDYSQYNTSEDYSAGLTKLTTEILAGNVPDILDTNSLPIQQYAAKGLLEDLWPLIDSDPDISRDSLMERVFTAAEVDGGLYQIFSSFSIATVVGRRDTVGSEMGWTMEQLLAALDTMPEDCLVFGQGVTRDSLLSISLMWSMDQYVDWTTGQCGFDTPAFQDILTFCASFPASFQWNEDTYESEPAAIQSGRQMLYPTTISSFDDLQMCDAMFGGGTTFIGYPTGQGCGSSFYIGSGMAMSSQCADKAGAWSFMRQILLPQSTGNEENFYAWQFPTNRADFQCMADQAMRQEFYTDENGNQVEQSHGGASWDGFSIEFYAATQEQYDHLMELYSAVDSLASVDMSIDAIVREEAASFFNGDKSVQETAALIQSRVSLYVNEQR